MEMHQRLTNWSARAMTGRGPFYVPTKRFGPHKGEEWDRYLQWSGLTQLRELVSLDGMMCLRVLAEIEDDFWPHIVREDYMLHYFTDLEYLLKRIAGIPDLNLLGVFLNPTEQPVAPSGPVRFSFCGYDLVEVTGDISALSNCGGFPNAFSNSELNEVGLLSDLARAREVQARLLEFYPPKHHSHSNCDVCAIFRAEEI